MNVNSFMPEKEMLLPAWSPQRRRLTTGLLTLFVLCCSLLLGYGVYVIGLRRGLIRQPLTKDSIYQAIMSDGGFLRAAHQSATLKTCVNEVEGFGFSYQLPLMLTVSGQESCRELIAVHPSGADVLITIESRDVSRRGLVDGLVAEFEVVDTDMLTGLPYVVSRLSGYVDGMATTYFVIEKNAFESFVISYSPTSPVLDGKVLLLVEQFWMK